MEQFVGSPKDEEKSDMAFFSWEELFEDCLSLCHSGRTGLDPGQGANSRGFFSWPG